MDKFFCKDLPTNRKKLSCVVKKKSSAVKASRQHQKGNSEIHNLFGKRNLFSKEKSQSYLDFGQVCNKIHAVIFSCVLIRSNTLLMLFSCM